jgi:hypothetical protein
MSTRPAASEPADSYFSLPSSRWDVIKFLLPPVLVAAWALVTMYFTQQSHGKQLDESQAAVASLQQGRQQGREEVFKALAILQTRVESQGEDVREMKRDIKELLKRP